MVDKGKAKRGAFRSPKTLSGRDFSGILLEPIAIPFFPELTGNPETDTELVKVRKSLQKRANAQLLERMKALARHYGLEYSADVQTLFDILKAFAPDILPGFQVNLKSGKGRPALNFKIGGERLFKKVNRHLEKDGGTTLQACEELSRHGPKWCRGHDPKALKTAYFTFKRMAIQAHRDAESDADLQTMIRVLGYDLLFSQVRKHDVNSKR